MIREIQAPEIWQARPGERTLFLAGSIEMGAAKPWQREIVDELKHQASTGEMNHIAILNPRRDDWDSSWEQTIESRQFREQVIWELDAMERSTMIALVFDPETKSPITLLELGLHHTDHLVVLCPSGFWRKGNVDIVCERYHITQVDIMDELMAEIIVGLG